MPVTATSPAKAPSTTTLAPVLPLEEEKNRDSSTIAAKSAMLAPHGTASVNSCSSFPTHPGPKPSRARVR